MAGFIGARASVVSSGAERKQTYAITTTTTSLTGLAYTPTKVHVYHNGIRLVDGTDYTATDGSSITLTTAAENGDEVVVISYATFQTSDTVSAANGGTFAGNVEHTGTLTASGALNTGTILPSTDNASDLGSTSKRFQDLHLSGGVSFDEDPSLVTGSVTGKTLDDYEEGTFTPVMQIGNNTGGITYQAQEGVYTKIGNLVYVKLRVRLASKGTNTGVVSIQGLPFALSDDFSGVSFEAGGVVDNWQLMSSAMDLRYYINGADREIYLVKNSGSTTPASWSGSVTDSDLQNTTGIRISLVYKTT
jgi:hypothetical protein